MNLRSMIILSFIVFPWTTSVSGDRHVSSHTDGLSEKNAKELFESKARQFATGFSSIAVPERPSADALAKSPEDLMSTSIQGSPSGQGRCSVSDDICLEKSTAILVKIDTSRGQSASLTSSVVAVFHRVPELPIGFRDSITFTIEESAVGLSPGAKLLTATAIADEFWIIEAEALLAHVVLSTKTDTRSTAQAPPDALAKALFSPTHDDNAVLPPRFDITDLVRLIDDTYRKNDRSQ